MPRIATMVELSAFDSEIFGLRFGRVMATPAAIADADAEALEAQLKSFDFVDARLPLGEKTAIERLLSARFEIVDAMLWLERQVGQPPSAGARVAIKVRDVATDDVRRYAEIAEALASVSRFSRYAGLGHDRARLLYSRWIDASLSGSEADAVLAAEFNADGQVAGLVTLKQHGPSVEMVLVAVSQRHAGKGIASHLITMTHERATLMGASCLVVKTMLSNTRAQRLYQTAGFRTRTAEWILHRRAQA
jgi:ribosomal protein S18 acetylase RimI-like enzyme